MLFCLAQLVACVLFLWFLAPFDIPPLLFVQWRIVHTYICTYACTVYCLSHTCKYIYTQTPTTLKTLHWVDCSLWWLLAYKESVIHSLSPHFEKYCYSCIHIRESVDSLRRDGADRLIVHVHRKVRLTCECSHSIWIFLGTYITVLFHHFSTHWYRQVPKVHPLTHCQETAEWSIC